MARSIIDPITRIEGHLRAGWKSPTASSPMRGFPAVASAAWSLSSAIAPRRCGVHRAAHLRRALSRACIILYRCGEGLQVSIPNNARIIRNLIEGSQFLHSHILWFYNLAGLDYVNPLNALSADPVAAYDLATELGTPSADFVGLQDRLKKFAENGQLSIFSGNWFDTGEYNLTPEADLVLTAHYLEALQMQAKASEIAGLLGGKMPHIMTIIPGGTAFVPTAEKLDDLKGLVDELYTWVANTMIPDTLALLPSSIPRRPRSAGLRRYGAWGVFERPSMEMNDKLPACWRPRRSTQPLRRR
ncbi:MAG: nickel-dependent hydrogenase large subunit [Slackia sp.]